MNFSFVWSDGNDRVAILGSKNHREEILHVT